MHYKCGTLAKLGDIVIGEGYNVKDENDKPKTFVGIVIGLVTDSETCNIRVAHNFRPFQEGSRIYTESQNFCNLLSHSVYFSAEDNSLYNSDMSVTFDIEYGETKSFLPLVSNGSLRLVSC